ncbi:hypothetical protein QBC40DRAFT_332238 [Triangularia verruculosa]|uniref:Nucleoside-diphosphate-sugar epimerase n=1 Tax=Triangularia verruculosa TaxID=2587418 RepID=A0AAN6XHP4_9PEZI|nr:hypothetical protein QBC40DRAFT_332238 [Triangularia verruculosa]
MHLILTGATGMVGTTVLDAMLKTTDISKISILSRRPVPLADDAKDPRVNVIIHKDFTSYSPDVLNKIQDADGCVWALGISQTQVSKDDYITITKTYPLAFASAFQPVSKKPFNFVYISGQGATFHPGLFTPLFGKTKGETELALAEFRRKNPFFQASTVRLGFVDWIEQDKSVTRYMPTLGAMRTGLGHLLHPVFKVGMKGNLSPTEPLGGFLTGLAMGRWDRELRGVKGGEGQVLEGGFSVVENMFFRRVMGLSG